MLDTDAVADVLEASRDGQGCGGQHRRLQVLKQCGTQDVRHRDRGGLEKYIVLGAASGAAFDPENDVALGRFQNESQIDAQLFHPSGQSVNFVGLVGNGLQLGVKVQQRILQAKILVAIFFQKLRAVLECETAFARRQQREEELRTVAHLTACRHNFRNRHIHPPQGLLDIAQQIVHPKIRDRDPEVVGGDVFQLVRFVEDDDAGVWQYTSVGRVVFGRFDRQVGAEQVMIDDDDVALGGAAAHLGDKAAVELLALRADAAVGARIQLGPQMAVLRQLGQLRAVASFGGLLPVAEDAEVTDLFQSVQQRLGGEVVELLAAEIIAAALHVADAQFAEMLPQKRNIFEEELFLQGLGAGRNDDAFARTDYRQQVGQRLASTGAGFDDQVAALLQRLLHRLRHLKLPAAEFVRRMSTCQHATRAEELKERR